MSEKARSADELDAIRQRKLERLRAGERTNDSESAADTTATDPGTEPTEPIVIDNQNSFRSLLDRHETVLADFSATWCGPCKTLEPILDRVAVGTPGAVASIDIDANPDLARQFNVKSVPTLIVFAGGEPTERLVGVQDEAVLTDLLERHAN